MRRYYYNTNDPPEGEEKQDEEFSWEEDNLLDSTAGSECYEMTSFTINKKYKQCNRHDFEYFDCDNIPENFNGNEWYTNGEIRKEFYVEYNKLKKCGKLIKYLCTYRMNDKKCMVEKTIVDFIESKDVIYNYVRTEDRDLVIKLFFNCFQ